MRTTWLIVAVLALVLGAVARVATPAGSEALARFCAQAGNDDTLRSAPPSLGPAIQELFHLGGAYALRTTV